MIRTVFIPRGDSVKLSIPKEYIGVKLEVIAFPLEESPGGDFIRQEVTFTDFGLDAPDYKFNREEANAR